MSREIKFRAWDKTRNDWVRHGSAVRLEVNSSQVFHLHQTEADNYAGYFADCGHIVVQQFTGLKDKNGKEIYEGDVVIGRMRMGENGEENYDFRGTIEYDTTNAKYGSTDADFDLGLYDSLEVISNIYENPEFTV